MATSRVSGTHLSHTVLALGMAILLCGLKLQGPYGFMHLEGLALGLYGLVASTLEAVALQARKVGCFSRHTEFWNAFFWEAHMVLLIVTHAIIYGLFRQPN